MWFDIPPEHRDKPEAIELLRLDAEFSRVLAESANAVAARLWESDPAAFDDLTRKERGLLQALKTAVAAYDQATGEPGPANLAREVVYAIHQQFEPESRDRVMAKLSETAGYLRRLNADESRVLRCILHLAQGDMARLEHHSALALVDWRDVIMSAGG
ncbi:hypothetical protein DES53_12068 [Roseimicrobium gellanilyticum]|uniref:Uncharacterized protein n=1 Tax=Roseimicrobium gellanilyticum TaxID=748857 RepID=A0A366H4C8_9BACT|nr:hypothetical protein [Roseimicrobium gellanilyticum]RBP35699.1 hypothetical protein DES53_12068 [Roseimicrobium gellanilyticum]